MKALFFRLVPRPACWLVVFALAWGTTFLARAQNPDDPDGPPPDEPGENTMTAPEAPVDEDNEALRLLREAMTNQALFQATNTLPAATPPPAAGAPPTNVTAPTAQPARTTVPVPVTRSAVPPPVVTVPAPSSTNVLRNRPAGPAALPPPTAQRLPGTGPGGPPTLTPANPTPGAPAPGVAALPGQAPGTGPATAGGEYYTVSLKGAALEQVFDEYGKLTGRTVLHQSNLQGTITLLPPSTARLSREDMIQAFEGALALNGITLIPQGTKFVKAVQAQFAPAEGSSVRTNSAEQLPDAEQFITQIIKLKVAYPSEVAQMLASFSKSKDSIIAIDSSQILVVRDFASNVKRMLQLIERVDVEPESEYKLEVIPIRYGKVTDLFDTMGQLVSGTGGGGAGYSRSGAAAGATGAMGRSGMTGGSGRTLGGRSGAGGRSNTYNRSGVGNAYGNNPYNPQATTGGVNPTGQPIGTTTGTSFQQRLNQIVTRAAGDNSLQLLSDARIVPDERSNSLIVYANKQDMQMITNIVAKVDALLAQVLIEGIVVSVSLGDSQSVGVNWAQNPKRFGQDFSGTGAINNGFFGIATNFPGASPDGFSYWGRLGQDVSVAVQALATDNKIRVLQRPRIQTTHAMPGVFFSGSTVPYVTGIMDYGGLYGGSYGSRANVQYMEVGVNLQVTPFITPDGLVVLDIYQEISQISDYVKIDNNDVPTTTTRSAQATLSVRDGETIMLGGYIEDSRSNTKSGVPLLKDIPGLGVLFRSSSDKKSRAELILLMKVTVLKKPADASALAELERSRLPALMKADKEFQKSVGETDRSR